MKPVQIDLFAIEGDTNVYTIQYLTDEHVPIATNTIYRFDA